MTEVITAIFLLTGAAFMLMAAIGVMRMPDTYTRMQPSTKAATLGAGCMMLAVAVHFSSLGVSMRALAGVVFLVLTAPVAAHMIGRAAYILGVPQWEGTHIDELKGRYDAQTHHLSSGDEADSIAECIAEYEGIIEETNAGSEGVVSVDKA
jgi:multicomponent Na+:H+ antiporter subunit G